MSENKKPNLAEVAGLDQDPYLFGGYLHTLRNPDKVLALEAGGDITVYDDIGRDDRIGSNLRTRALAVIGKEWTVTPAGDGPQDEAVADYVKQVLAGFSFDLARRGILRGGLLKGYAVSEIMWDRSEGDIFIADMKHRAQRRFVFDIDGDLHMLTPADMIEGVNVAQLHPKKFQTFIFGDEAETPYGVGLGRELYWPWWFKKNDLKFWLIFGEKFAAPTPLGKYPAGASPEEKATLLDACQAFQTDAGIIIPEGMSLDLLEAARGGNISSYRELAEFLNSAISVVILGQTASTQGTAGKLGNEDAQENVRDDLTKADADALCEALNGQVVRWLVDYQFPGYSGGRKYPKTWVECGDEADQQRLSERDKNLAETGVRFKPQHYVDTYGLPLENFEVTPPAAPTVPPAEFAEQPDRPDAADQLAEQLALDAGGEEQRWIEQIRALLDSAESLEAFRDQLAELYPDLDDAEFGELLARAMTLADLVGREEVNAGDQ